MIMCGALDVRPEARSPPQVGTLVRVPERGERQIRGVGLQFSLFSMPPVGDSCQVRGLIISSLCTSRELYGA